MSFSAFVTTHNRLHVQMYYFLGKFSCQVFSKLFGRRMGCVHKKDAKNLVFQKSLLHRIQTLCFLIAGLEECDIENTAIAMIALSEQKKPSDSIKSTQSKNRNDIERYDTHKDNRYTLAGLARPDSISKSKPKFRLIRTKREDNSGSLQILTHNISKRALGGIIRKMIRGLCRSDPLSCYDVTLIHPNQRKRITNYRQPQYGVYSN